MNTNPLEGTLKHEDFRSNPDERDKCLTDSDFLIRSHLELAHFLVPTSGDNRIKL
jgi:hypothetical protein